MKLSKAASHLKQMIRRLKGQELAGRDSDPNFLAYLDIMPNPDPILRRMGMVDLVHDNIMRDAHVKGDVRSIRGALRRLNYRLLVGDADDKRSVDALELCKEWMSNYQPSKEADWLELLWQMMTAIFYGFKVHELDWQYVKPYHLPVRVTSRPGRRFAFNHNAELLLKTKEKPNGYVADMFYFIVSQNMATTENPYGDALLNSCFYPKLHKDGATKVFVQYCEKYGLPWPVARYPVGTPDDDIDKLENVVSRMVSNGYVVAADGTGLELLTPSNSGSALPQENLINQCNREMSKALTSQAMVSELHNTGARAASETAQKRQDGVNDSDRDIAVRSFNRILKLITEVNFGDDVAPPVLEFYDEVRGGKERAEVFEIAARIGKPSLKAFHEEMQIPIAEDDGDILKAVAPQKPSEFSEVVTGLDFAKAGGDGLGVVPAVDGIVRGDFIEPVAAMLKSYEDQGKTLQEFSEDLGGMFVGLSDKELHDVTSEAMQVAFLEGMADGS